VLKKATKKGESMKILPFLLLLIHGKQLLLASDYNY